MPGFGRPLDDDLEAEDRAAPNLATSAGESYWRSFTSALDPRPAAMAVYGALRPVFDMNAAVEGHPEGLSQGEISAVLHPPKLTSDEANARYGVDGYLRFNEPVQDDEAAFKSHMALERRFSDFIADKSNPSPLLSFGAGLGGAILNPANVTLAAVTGGLGEEALAASGVKTGLESLGVLGKVANVVGTGALDQVPFVAANYGEARYLGSDYDAGDALRDIAAGAVLHTTLHAAFRGAHGLYAGGGGLDAEAAPPGAPETPAPAGGLPGGRFEPDPAPASGVPAAVDALPETSRQGAFALAVDQLASDKPVDVGALVAREIEPPSLARLDEEGNAPRIPSWRELEPGAAITTRGSEVPVRYGLAELSDLTTSHGDNLEPNPAYPPELQPRDRARAGAQARNYQLEQELNPKLLLNDAAAGAGAPIVAPDGVVESGNGRTIALRRSAANGGEAYARYKAELQAQGLDTAGMDKPVLVRMRDQPLTGAQRAALAREMNADVTERMSATEQAMTDAGRIDDALVELGANGSLRDAEFARAFIARVAGDQTGVLVDREGRLSPEGERRIRAAVLARAYQDPGLVGQIFEGEDSDARKLGEALAEAAPGWARMRAAAGRGEIPRALDLTQALTSAMDLVRHAAREKIPLAELLAERLGQTDMFSGEAISPETEAFVRLFYRDEGLKKPLAAARIAAALKDYARQAMAVTPGPDLFGDAADGSTARRILALAAEKYAKGDAGDLDLRPPGRAAGPVVVEPAVQDVLQPGGGRDGGDAGLPPQAGGGADREGGREQPARGPTAEQLIAADPELKALADDTARLEAAKGVEPAPPEPRDQPQTIADAVRAAALCLTEEAQ